MKTADDHWDTRRAQRLRDMQRTRVLIRLNTDQAYKAEIVIRAHVANDAIDAHASIIPSLRVISLIDVRFDDVPRIE